MMPQLSMATAIISENFFIYISFLSLPTSRKVDPAIFAHYYYRLPMMLLRLSIS